jgi:two-component system response regulator YesN
MEAAAKLLSNGNLKILDVAALTGYTNQRYFSECFKKYYHCTPTEYRKRT